MKRKYIKPEFKTLSIDLNDMCVGSACVEVEVEIPRGNKTERTFIFTEHETEEMWDCKF